MMMQYLIHFCLQMTRYIVHTQRMFNTEHYLLCTVLQNILE